MTPSPPGDAPPAPDVLSRDLTAERAVLGAMILAPDRIVDIAGTGLEADDFHRPVHGTLYDVLTAMYATDQPIDPITVKGHFDAHGWPPGLAPIHLIQVIEAVPTPGHGIHYARIVTGHAHRRRLADAVTRAAHDLKNPAVHLTDVTDRLDTDLTAAQAAESAEPPGWPPPTPLATRPTLPPFPVTVLPDWLADMVAAVAEFTQTPPDLAGTIALAALSTAAGGRAVVEVRGSWREPVNLFTVVVLPPGSRKSAVFAAITGPLLTAERDLIERTKPAIIEAKLARKVATRTAEKAAQIAASVDADRRVNALAEAAGAAMTADAVTIPVEPRLIADDITSEAAATLLAEQGGRLAVLSAEGGIFATLAGRYSGTPNLEVFLKGHAGDMLRVDRKGRPAEHIKNPALTLGLAVQPDILRDLADMPGFRGRGLLARILFAVPANTVGYRRINTDPVPAHVHTRYTDNLTALITTMADWSTDPAVLQLTPDANQAVIGIEQTIEPRLAPGGTWGHIVDWGSKYTGAVVRLAGLLHLAEHRTDGWRRPITATTLTAAAALGEYYAAHATAAFDDMGTDPTLDKARTVLHRLTTHPTSRISRRDLFTALPRSRFRKITDLDPALDLLDQHGYLRPAPAPPATGGRPASPTYLPHPPHPHHPMTPPHNPHKPPFCGFCGDPQTPDPHAAPATRLPSNPPGPAPQPARSRTEQAQHDPKHPPVDPGYRQDRNRTPGPSKLAHHAHQESDHPATPARPGPRELLPLAQVLAELGDERGPLARSTFDDWRARGAAPKVIKLPNGQLRIDRAEFNAWLDSRIQEPAA